MAWKSKYKGSEVESLLDTLASGAIKGGGIEIVDSVDKLDPNAELGSMASVVTPGSIQETSLSNLPQPDASIIDPTTYVLDASNCPLVSGLSVLVPTSTIPVTATISENEMIYFVSESVDLYSMAFGTMLGIMPLIQNGELSALMAMYMDVATMTEKNFTLFSITNGVVTADQDAINQVNTLINGLYYVGAMMYVMQGKTLSAEVLAVYDMVVKAVAGVPSIADIYLKKNDWEKLYAKDFEKLTSNITKVEESVNAKADKTNILAQQSNHVNMKIEPNKYYRYKVSSNYQTLSFVLLSSNEQYYEEYLIEVVDDGNIMGISFKDSDKNDINITWANGIAPTFAAGMTYIISIANGFGVYAMFPNS